MSAVEIDLDTADYRHFRYLRRVSAQRTAYQGQRRWPAGGEAPRITHSPAALAVAGQDRPRRGEVRRGRRRTGARTSMAVRGA